MGKTILMLFVCLAAPLSMMLFIFEGKARQILGFLFAGIFMCMFAGEINGLFLAQTDHALWFVTVNVTPIVEEILKALPVVFIAFVFKPKPQFLLEAAIMVGVGFATMENVCLLFESSGNLPALEIVSRGIGAGMMHGVSTLAVGFSMTFASSSRKLSYAGTVAALSTAIIYHSIYNMMVQSDYPILGILLPGITFIPFLIYIKRKNRPDRENDTVGS